MGEPTTFDDGLRQIADLSGEDRTTREVIVLETDPITKVPTKTIDARPSPYDHLPVEHAGEKAYMARTLCAEPGSAVDVQGDLANPTAERGHSSLVTSTERLEDAGAGTPPEGAPVEVGTTPRVAPQAQPPAPVAVASDVPFPADQAPTTHLVHVVAGRACLVGNDARERTPAEAAKGLAPAGGYLAWARTLPGSVADIVTRLGDAAGPMKRGFGTPFEEAGAANLDRVFSSESVPGAQNQRRAGKIDAFVTGGASFAPAPTAQDLPSVRFARDQTGDIRAYDQSGRPIEGLFIYRDRHGTTRWFDPGSGRRGFVTQVINVGLPGYHGTGSLYDGFLNPDGTITLGIRDPGRITGVEAVRDETFTTASLERPVLIRDADGIPRTVVAVERNGFGRYTLITIDGSRFSGSFADIREAENGDVFIRDPSTGRGVFLGNTRPGTVTLGFGGGIEYNVLPGGELGIPVGLPQGGRVLRASITGIVYPVGSPQYRSVVDGARREAARIISSATGQAPPSSVISELGPQRFTPGNLGPEEQERLQLALDIVEDGRRGLPIGTTTAQRKEHEAEDLARGQADAIARRPHETGLLLETLFGPYNGIAYPLAFNAPLSQSARSLTSVGRRWGVGYFLELGGKWRPVCPIDDALPPAPPPTENPPAGGDDETPPPEQKLDEPPAVAGEDDLENVGGQLVPRGLPWERPRDGELAACDEDPHSPRVPTPPERPPSGLDEPHVVGIAEPGLVSTAPGTRGARIDAFAGATRLQPRMPRMNPAGDQRQRLGGGPYLRGAPLVPRGGIRLIDRWDFHRGHSATDALNLAFDTINRLTSLVNERFPFAPDAIQGAGLKLPGQPLERVRVEQFDPGTIVNVAVVTERGTRTVAPHVVLRDRRGVKRLRPLAGDHLAERLIGLGDPDEDVLIRFDHGAGRERDRSDLPTIGWDRRTKSLVVRNAPLDVVNELTVVEDDGTQVKVGKATPEAYAVPRAGPDGKLDAGWIPETGGGGDADTLDGLDSTAFQTRDEKNAANGYAGLDGNARVPLARGGTAADLSGTGGAGHVLKQSSAGAVITVGALTAGDLPVHTHQSGAQGGTLDAAAIASGTLSMQRGGTGLGSFSPSAPPGHMLAMNAAGSAFELVGPNTTTTRKFLRMTGTGTLGGTPAWDTLQSGDVPAHTHTEADIQLGATDRLVGRDTAGAGAAEELTVGGGIEFTGSGGIRRSALTGDVTASAGSNATTIANDVVTYAKMQNISATQRVLGRNTAGAGDTEEVTIAQALAWLLTTRGQIIRRGASAPEALTLGEGVLKSDGTDVVYGKASARVFDLGTVGSSASTGSIGFTPTACIVFAHDNDIQLSVGYATGTGSADQAAAAISWGTGAGATLGWAIYFEDGASSHGWAVTAFSSSGITVTRSGTMSAVNVIIVALEG